MVWVGWLRRNRDRMLWLFLLSVALILVVPPVLALAEGVYWRGGPPEVTFWTLARSVAGTCHVPWGRRGSPVIRFPLPFGEGRVRAVKGVGRQAAVVEVRGYQTLPFGFSARICSPPAPPARWHAPGLSPVTLESDAEQLGYCSLEATDESLLRWLLRHTETRDRLDALQVESHADSVEVILAGQVILLRAQVRQGLPPAGALDAFAPYLIEALRRLSDDLHDLACALEDAGEPMHLTFLCRGCGTRLGNDPWHCPSCHSAMHRGCREMIGGCGNPACGQAPDAVPAALT